MPRGAAKEQPDQVKLSPEDLQRLITDHREELGEEEAAGEGEGESEGEWEDVASGEEEEGDGVVGQQTPSETAAGACVSCIW